FDRYGLVTPAEVQKVARQYLTSGRVRLVVRPKAETSVTPTMVDRTLQPSPAQAPAFQPPIPRRIRLDNGSDLLVVEKHEIPTVACAVYLPGGAIGDPAGKPGLLAFSGRLLQEGTKNRTSTQIADESDFIAARPNFSTDREDFIASTEALTKHWPKALELL